tara:strand:- start:24 stop:1055 length:1032 start_codon:yes stop_codon:yes gene_type:complete
MLKKTQIEEFRKYLKKSENPLFFFDDDPDGLCSYLILKKYIDKGKGAVLKTKSTLDLNLYHKVEEYMPDFIFVLDIPIIDQEFIDKSNVPIIWLDHHKPVKRKGVKYFNPLLNGSKTVPTTYMAYKIAEEKDLLLGTVGSIADWYYPSFAKKFSKKYPDLLPEKIKNPPEAIFNSKLGEIINIFAFSLKKQTSKVHKISNLLLKIDDPYELLKLETSRTKFIAREIKQVSNEYESLMKIVKRQKPKKEKLFIFDLPKTKNSYTSIVSNYLIYKHPTKIILVAKQKEDVVLMSLRSDKIDIRKILEKTLEGLDGFGGGHKNACGASISKRQYEEFIERFNEYLK